MKFVTGGTGLVGAHLLYKLIEKGEKVRALKRKSSDINQVLKTFSYYSKEPKNLFDKIEWVTGDILDCPALIQALQGVTEIYHCAAIVSFERKQREKMIANNVEGTANMVNAAIESGIKKICHVSSIAALGKNENGEPVIEETNWIPSKRISGYSESKFFSEMEIWRGIQEGLDAVIVNPSIIFGPANWNTGSAKMFKTIYDGLKFYTKGITGFVDVNDVTNAMLRLMDDENFEECKNQRFILNAENLSYQQVFNKIADALEKPRPKYYSSNILLGLVWRLASFWEWITRKPSMLTKEAVANSNQAFYFDGSKISRKITFHYQSVDEAIHKTSQYFLNDISLSQGK